MQHISRWCANLVEPVAICHHSTVAEALSPASCVSREPEPEPKPEPEMEGWGTGGRREGSEWETSLSDASGDVGLSWDTWMDRSLLWRRSHNRLSNCCCPLSGCATHLSQTQALNYWRPLWFLKRTHFLPYDDTYSSCVSSISHIKNRTTSREHTVQTYQKFVFKT